MDFGHHRNKLLRDVPLSYVQWMSDARVLDNKWQRYFFVQAYPGIFGFEPAVPNMTTTTMDFGRHVNSLIVRVPVSYVRWMAANDVLNGRDELKVLFAALYPLLFPAVAAAPAVPIPVAAFLPAAAHVVVPAAIEEVE